MGTAACRIFLAVLLSACAMEAPLGRVPRSGEREPIAARGVISLHGSARCKALSPGIDAGLHALHLPSDDCALVLEPTEAPGKPLRIAWETGAFDARLVCGDAVDRAIKSRHDAVMASWQDGPGFVMVHGSDTSESVAVSELPGQLRPFSGSMMVAATCGEHSSTEAARVLSALAELPKIMDNVIVVVGTK